MFSHSRTLFKLDDGTKMKFVILRPSFDASIVTSLIQWGGGSVSIENVPVEGAINLACKQLYWENQEIYNTSFVHASCLTNKLLDISGFSLGRSQLGEKSGSISKENAGTTPDMESLTSKSCDDGSSLDMLSAWLKDSLCETASKKIKERKEDESSITSMSNASTVIPIYDRAGPASVLTEIWPHDSASAVKPNFTETPPESSQELREDQDASTSGEDRISHRIQMWLGSNSSQSSDERK